LTAMVLFLTLKHFRGVGLCLGRVC